MNTEGKMTTLEEESLKLDNQLCFPLYVASRKVISLYHAHLKALDLTYTQYLVLMVLWETDGIPVSELGKRLFLDNGTLTPLLKKMEHQGYLSRTRAAKDERVVIISLTETGKNMKEKCRSIPAAVGDCLKLDKEQVQTLYLLLYDMIRQM